MDQISANRLVYSFMTQYNRLTDIINLNYSNSPATKINLFIDLNSIFSRIYKGYNVRFAEDSYTLHGCIISLCYHYRHFFRSRYNVDSNIYIIDSDNCCKVNRLIMYQYNKNYNDIVFHNKILGEYLMETRSILSQVCQFIENVSYIRSEQETGVVIKDIIMNENNGSPNLILTKDLYNFQLVDDNTFILYPSKKEVDNSIIINPYNCIDFIIYKRNIEQKEIYNNISPELLPILYTFTRLPERNISSLVSIPVFVKQLSKLINLNLIMNKKNTDPRIIYNLLCRDDNNFSNKFPYIMIESRFKVIDIDYQYLIYRGSNDYIAYGYKGMVNLYNPELLMDLAKKYFRDNEVQSVLDL